MCVKNMKEEIKFIIDVVLTDEAVKDHVYTMWRAWANPLEVSYFENEASSGKETVISEELVDQKIYLERHLKLQDHVWDEYIIEDVRQVINNWMGVWTKVSVEGKLHAMGI